MDWCLRKQVRVSMHYENISCTLYLVFPKWQTVQYPVNMHCNDMTSDPSNVDT